MERLVRGFTSGVFAVAVIFLIIRLILMASFPVAGDEAYYFFWGDHFSGGYYDLSPMVGWWESIFEMVSLHPFWLRLPNLIALAAVSFGMYEWISRFAQADRAKKIAALFFFSPIPFLAVLISPDVPLLFFSFFAVLLFYQERASSKFFSGALWGAAFLSKYFALFLLPAFGIWFLIQKRKSFVGLLCFIAGALPFLFQHLYWNSNHCWANFVFNLVTRQAVNDGSRMMILGLFALYLIVLGTPILIGSIRKKDAVELSLGFDRIAEFTRVRSYLLWMWLIPIAIFAVTALMGKGQGLHWYLSYVPFFVMWVGLGLTEEETQSRLKVMLAFTGVLAIIAVTVSIAPRATLGRIFAHRHTYEFNTVTLGHEYVQTILPALKDVDLVMTDGYTQSAVLDYLLRRYGSGKLPVVNVLDEGSRFGRVFDWTIDWKAMEGKNVAIITRGLPDLPRWQKYFFQFKPASYEIGSGDLKSGFYITSGNGFKASVYHSEVLKPALHGYYPTEMLPFRTEACRLGILQ